MVAAGSGDTILAMTDIQRNLLSDWASGRMRPAAGSSAEEIRAWYEDQWQGLIETMGADLPGWWQAFTELSTTGGLDSTSASSPSTNRRAKRCGA